VGFKLNQNHVAFRGLEGISIFAKIRSSEDLVGLAMAKDALEQAGARDIDLILPYVPYARQDRMCDKGEAFALKVFCKILNSLNFKSVTIVDPHSEVTPALIDNVKVVSQLAIIEKLPLEIKQKMVASVFVSPDAGANKKTAKLASFFGHSSFIRADKNRDLTNGNILETIVYCDDLKGQNVTIVDDLCDGGKTFIELSKVLKQKNAGKIYLYVTHGIFSRGVDALLDAGIDEIWTTNSWADIKQWREVIVLDLEAVL
jgi:ribose-phosphate pyrophosphokinase